MGSENGITELGIEMIVVIVASAISYFVLYLVAKKHPGGHLAKPHGVRDVWIMINGVLVGIVFVGLLWMIMETV